jgi:hypothetical protein
MALIFRGPSALFEFGEKEGIFPGLSVCKLNQGASKKAGLEHEYIHKFHLISFEVFMLVTTAEKQRRAISVVKTALSGLGISGRSVCVSVRSETHGQDDDNAAAVFISAPVGSNIEPYYETGKTIAEAVKNLINSLKGRTNGAKPGTPEIAPF